jgi:hypothetical protein
MHKSGFIRIFLKKTLQYPPNGGYTNVARLGKVTTAAVTVRKRKNLGCDLNASFLIVKFPTTFPLGEPLQATFGWLFFEENPAVVQVIRAQKL